MSAQVAQMEVELPSMPLSIRQNYQGRLSTSKQALEKVKRSLVSAVHALMSEVMPDAPYRKT